MWRTILVLMFFLVKGFSYTMSDYVSNHSTLNSFDYGKYLNNISFNNIKKLDIDRDKADFIQEGDNFLYRLTDYFIKNYAPSMSHIENTISIGENFLTFTSGKGVKHDEIYKIIGYYILGKCAKIIEKDIKNNSSIFGHSDRIKNLRQRLKQSRIHIKLKKNTLTKLIENIKSGNFSYIWDRICKEFCDDSVKVTSSPIKLKVFKPKDDNIFFLSKEQKIIGEIIWLKRPQYKAHYFAKGNVYSKYKNFLSKNNLNPRIVMTGGFTNSNRQPEGLTIEKGNIVNAVLMHDRDGLIIVRDNGGINVINLKRGKFILPKTNIQIDPLNNIMDYSKLIKWSKKNNATFFQTQLLAFSNKVLINKNIAKKTARERRLLALGSNKKGEVYHLIINVRQGVSLADITEKVFELLEYRKYKVEAILNLDVGSYDIMEVYSSKKIVLTAPISIRTATNLLFYTE